jgi:hypothetical protein
MNAVLIFKLKYLIMRVTQHSIRFYLKNLSVNKLKAVQLYRTQIPTREGTSTKGINSYYKSYLPSWIIIGFSIEIHDIHNASIYACSDLGSVLVYIGSLDAVY